MGSQTQTKPAAQETIATVEELPPVQAVQVEKDNPQPSVPEEASKVCERLFVGCCLKTRRRVKLRQVLNCAILSTCLLSVI